MRDHVPNDISTGVAEKEALVAPSRRKALARLGLAAGVAYVAPTVLRLDKLALAAGKSCNQGKDMLIKCT